MSNLPGMVALTHCCVQEGWGLQQTASPQSRDETRPLTL